VGVGIKILCTGLVVFVAVVLSARLDDDYCFMPEGGKLIGAGLWLLSIAAIFIGALIAIWEF
jgi:hypothetical protein